MTMRTYLQGRIGFHTDELGKLGINEAYRRSEKKLLHKNCVELTMLEVEAEEERARNAERATDSTATPSA